jgi:hypothetical protein
MPKGIAWKEKCNNCNVAANCNRTICVREMDAELGIKGKWRRGK